VLGELLQEPGVVEDLDLGSRVGFLAIHGGLEPGTRAVRARRTTRCNSPTT
jgi:phage replication-related protein YjqB (UPF0714/DUF867 family)